MTTAAKRYRTGLSTLLGLGLLLSPVAASARDYVETVTGTVTKTEDYEGRSEDRTRYYDTVTVNFASQDSVMVYKPYTSSPNVYNRTALNFMKSLTINGGGTIINDGNTYFSVHGIDGAVGGITGNGKLFLNDIQERRADSVGLPNTGSYMTHEGGGETVPISGGMYVQLGGRAATAEAVRSGGVELDNFHLLVRDPGTQLMVGGLPGMTPKENGSVFKMWYGGKLTVEYGATVFTNSKIDQKGGLITVGGGSTLTAVDGLVMKPGVKPSTNQTGDVFNQALVEVRDGGTVLLGNAFTGKALDFQKGDSSRFRVLPGGRLDIGMPAEGAAYFTGVNVRVPFEANAYARVRSYGNDITLWDGGRIALSDGASVYAGQDVREDPRFLGVGVIIENQHTLNVEMRSAQDVTTPFITGGNGLVMRKGSTLKGLIAGDLAKVGAGTTVTYAIADKALLNDTPWYIPTEESAKFTTDNVLFSMNIKGDHTAGSPLSVNVTRDRVQDRLPQLSGSAATLINDYTPGTNSFVDAVLKGADAQSASKALESGMNMQAASNTAQVAQGLSSQLGGFSQQRAAGQSLGSQSLVATLLPGSGAATTDSLGNQSNAWTLSMGSDTGMNGGDMLSQAAASTLTQGLGIWAMPTYGHERLRDMSVGAFKTGADSDIYGGLFGADFTWDAWRVGLAGNIGAGESKSVGDLAKTKNELDYAGLNLYGSHTWGNFTLGANMGYTHVKNDVKQDNLVGELRSKFSSDVWNAGLRGDYRIVTEYANITPTLGVEYTHYRQKGYDTDLFDQAVVSSGKANMDTWRVPVGVTVDKSFELESGGVIAPEFRVRYIPTLGDRNMKTPTWLPGSSAVATMTGADADRHTGEVGLGLQYINNNLSLSTNYDFQFSQHRQAHGVTAQVRYTF